MAKPPNAAYRCIECGWTAPKFTGQCGECQAYGTVLSVGEQVGITQRSKATAVSGDRVAVPLTETRGDDTRHEPTGVREFDRVLGGGIVPGAAILLSGEPGVGKSTLLLEVAVRAARGGRRVLYVSAEESVNQIRMRAERTGALHENLFVASETDLGLVLGQTAAISPQLLIVDSVQTVANPHVDGLAGGPSQVREVATALLRVAKNQALPLILVGHVTKDGTIAGPRALEHLVDVVCQFEGDRQTALRFVRALKNRFGPTDEVGCFEMTGEGISEVPDPSGLFLSRSSHAVSGTCVTVALEGRRALPVEVQALVVATSSPNPRRVTNGVESSRVAMLLAVLERRAGLSLSDKDVYVSTVGGVRLNEPGADLAIAIALASAFHDKPVAHTVAACGEISLAGEVRPVTGATVRANEATRVGYETLIDSTAGTLREALAAAFRTASTTRERELDAAF